MDAKIMKVGPCQCGCESRDGEMLNGTSEIRSEQDVQVKMTRRKSLLEHVVPWLAVGAGECCFLLISNIFINHMCSLLFCCFVCLILFDIV